MPYFLLLIEEKWSRKPNKLIMERKPRLTQTQKNALKIVKIDFLSSAA